MSKQTRTSERKSTIEKSQELESRLRRREIEAQEKKSKKLANIREKELESFVKEAQEIINLADRLEESETSFGADTTLDPLGALTPDGLARARSVSTGLNRFECGNASSLSPERAGLERNIFGGSLRTINEVFENDKMDNNDGFASDWRSLAGQREDRGLQSRDQERCQRSPVALHLHLRPLTIDKQCQWLAQSLNMRTLCSHISNIAA